MDNDFEHTIKLNGFHGFVFSADEEGLDITVSGWNNDHWNYKEGDRVLLVHKEGEVRYLINEVEHCYDPYDMYFIKCSFCPREEKQ